MANLNSNDPQLLGNLATALREAGKQTNQQPRPPAVTDEDILHAMLGKPWNSRQTKPARKAG